MYFKQILDERCGCASYLIASRQTNEAAIIDPAINVEQYDALLAERGFTLKLIIDTHVHADHVSGARLLREKHGAELCLHESAQVTYPFRGLKDGEELPLGQLRLKVVHTPGHRPELISLLVTNPERSTEASMVLTGDSLLVGDVGRPDFGGGDAVAQYDSISRLLRLPDWVAVFPGHFEGPCGKGMCGRPSTTIGFERLFNPLTRQERASFVLTLTDGIPARPLNMSAIEATNRGLRDMPWVMLTDSRPVPEIDVDELAQRASDGFVVDVREPEEYAHGHVPGAVNIPQCDLATHLEDIPRDRPVMVICQGGFRSYRSAQFLQQMKLENVTSVRGGTEAWIGSGRPVSYGDTTVAKPKVAESEWAHAGAMSYSI